MKTYRVAVTGGRDHEITEEEERRFRALLQEKWISEGVAHLVVLHGDYRGVDQRAAEIAELCGFPSVPFQAPWDFRVTLWGGDVLVSSGPEIKKLGTSAGPLRNYMMLKAADLLVAFPGERGTANCMRQARELGVEVVTL